jgi:hypothetical protein
MIRVYLETTVFNRYFEDGREFCTETKLLFDKIAGRKIEAFTSVYVLMEIEKAPEPKRSQMLKLIGDYNLGTFNGSQEAQELADVYVETGIIPARFKMDGIHIAMTAIHRLDCIVSLNFNHITKLKTKTATEIVHKIKGYSSPYICTPAEVLENESF